MQIPYISADEQLMLTLIAQGKSSRAIREEIGDHANRLRAGLRHKTGIPNTRDARFSREYLDACQAALSARQPLTEDELAAIRNVANDGFPRSWSDADLALFNRAAAKAAIFTRYPAEVRTQCRAFINQQRPIPALTTFHKQVLRLYAEGKEPEEIAQLLPDTTGAPRPFAYIRKLVADGIKMLDVTSEGRGVQRRLLSIALAQIEQKPTQKDPLDDF